MNKKTLRLAIFAGIVGVMAMFTISNAEAQRYGYHDEASRSGLQYCYPEYDRSLGRNRVKQYSGYCYATFNFVGDPLYLYKEYRLCEIERRSKGILSYTKYDCGRNRFERMRHPYYRPPPRDYGHDYYPPYRGHDPYQGRDRDRYDRDHRRRGDDHRRGNGIPRGDDRRDERRDQLRKQRDRG